MACSDLELARIDGSVRRGERPSDRERGAEGERSLLSRGTGSILLAGCGGGCCISETPHLASSEGTVWARRRRRPSVRSSVLLAIRPCTFDSRSARWNIPLTIHSHRVYSHLHEGCVTFLDKFIQYSDTYSSTYKLLLYASYLKIPYQCSCTDPDGQVYVNLAATLLIHL